jgi:alpha-galactosidase
VADAIARAGRTPGVWIAPFLAAPDSELVRTHPDWFARASEGDGFAIGMYNDEWGGVMAELDTTRVDVLDHLAHVAAALVDAGYRYLKLDFTFSAAMPGRYADRSRTPAERVRAGYDAVRRGAGDDVLILACGAPIGAVVGVADAMRIGADVAPWWSAPPGRGEQQPGYDETTPATRNAFVNTCTRSFMHRRLWSNDPDCVMLRADDTHLDAEAARAWAETVACSGGLVLVSDDLTRLGGEALALLDAVVERGRAADAAARAGDPPRCDGLLDPDGPAGLAGAGGTVRVDLPTGHGGLVRGSTPVSASDVDGERPREL